MISQGVTCLISTILTTLASENQGKYKKNLENGRLVTVFTFKRA